MLEKPTTIGTGKKKRPRKSCYLQTKDQERGKIARKKTPSQHHRKICGPLPHPHCQQRQNECSLSPWPGCNKVPNPTPPPAREVSDSVKWEVGIFILPIGDRTTLSGCQWKSQGELGLSFPPGGDDRPHPLLAGVMSEEALWRVETFNNAPPKYQSMEAYIEPGL